MEKAHQVFNRQVLLFFSFNINHDFALVEHDQAITICDGMVHIMRNHQGCQIMAFHDLLRQFHDHFTGLWIERCGVFIQ